MDDCECGPDCTESFTADCACGKCVPIDGEADDRTNLCRTQSDAENNTSGLHRLTHEQALILTVYTGHLLVPFDKFHAFAESALGRPVLTLEMGSAGTFWDDLKAATKPELADLAPGYPNE